MRCFVVHGVDFYFCPGRAGRDSMPANCYLLACMDDDSRMLSLAHSQRIPRLSIALLLLHIFRRKPMLDKTSGRTNSNINNDACCSICENVALDLRGLEAGLDIPGKLQVLISICDH